ncbi:ATP-binding cassette domain-containing protein [Vibrio europaeus]|uniref:ATP-binding cassette domain-containing protein n=1 Tax=Vibrio europaeus TaxID=300876 RepID=UPI00148D86C9|nr:ATP-binding cassette domain-containing protein [Vibrio europaeus]NOH26303.1 ABC-F family ATP-binding cassette domain-containing protein [Vibrio europaeus]
MPVLQANKISYHFDNGEVLFSDISCSLTQSKVGLVGRNGVGKSILASILTKALYPTQGEVALNASVKTYTQLPSKLLDGNITVAQYLGVESVLRALAKIEQGDCDEKWFEIVGEQWSLKRELESQLGEMQLPRNADFLCSELSGGQLARLQLWQLFQSEAQLLVLDEPSNHLDKQGREWLREQMNAFAGHIFLISHDRFLLREMEQIWELSTLGLAQYGGNYDDYRSQKELEVTAVERQLDSVHKEQKRLERQAQKNKEKAEQRQAKGMKARRSGSQPKILLDGMKDSAERTMSNKLKNENSRRDLLDKKEHALNKRSERLKAQKFYMGESHGGRKGQLVSIVNGVLPYGCQEPIHLQLTGTSKLWLHGGNGSGKSTLLNILRGKSTLLSGDCYLNTPLFYLDQHFGLLDNTKTLLETVMEMCSGLVEAETRTLLAGIGFRRDSVFRTVRQLSGGEKMKLSMLVVSHQLTQPVLLLDEPDNHLDLESKQLLAQTLNQYGGAFVLVSHDEDFVQESGVNETYSLSNEF